MNRWIAWGVASIVAILELLLMILVFVNVVPLEPASFRTDASYSNYITEAHSTFIGTVVTEWFFFLLTVAVLIPTNLIVIAELTRWALNRRNGVKE